MSLRRFFQRGRWDDERARELEAYLAQEIDDNLARGMTPEQARRAAHRKLGNPARIREQIYDFNTIALIETLRLDLRDAWRQLRRRWRTAAASAALLALGIGASTAGFAIVYGTLLRPLPYPDADRLVALWQQREGRLEQISAPDYRDLSAAPVFEQAALLWGSRSTLVSGDAVERVMTVEAEPALLPMLGAQILLGRPLGGADVHQPIALITGRLWRRVFHEDPAIVGRAIHVTGRPFTVVGVLADAVPFELPVGDAQTSTEFAIKDVDIWMPFDAAGHVPDRRDVWAFEAIGRLRAGVGLAEAQAAVDTIGTTLARQFPDSNRGRGFRLVPLRQQMVGARAAAIWLGFGGALLMLVVACVNAAGLVLGELPSRRRDFALRQALGAGRTRLLRQVAVESALVAGGSAIGGLLLAGAIGRAFVASMDLPRADAVRLDALVMAFAIAAAFGCALASRLVPMLRLDGDLALRSSASPHAASAPRLRRALVAAQLAMALVSCTTAALLAASLRAVLLVDPGFAAAHTLSARVSAYDDSYPTRQDVTRFFTELTQRLASQPAVTVAASVSSLPLSGSGVGTSVAAEGQAVAPADRITAGWQTATPGFFRAMGIPLRAGRDFVAADLLRGGAHHTIVNETLARELFGAGGAIGRRIALGPQGPAQDWHEIVGVVGDVRQGSLTDPPLPRVYDLFGEHWSRTMFVVVQGRENPVDLAPLVRGDVRALNPAAPVFDVRSLDDLVNASVAPRRSVAALAGGLGAAALLLAALGVYGLLASSVAARTRELGIRRALGASTRAIVALVAGEALILSGVGIAAGLAASAAAAGAIQAQLFGVTAANPVLLAACAAGLAAVALAASVGPARRAARVDPSVTLRGE